MPLSSDWNVGEHSLPCKVVMPKLLEVEDPQEHEVLHVVRFVVKGRSLVLSIVLLPSHVRQVVVFRW